MIFVGTISLDRESDSCRSEEGGKRRSPRGRGKRRPAGRGESSFPAHASLPAAAFEASQSHGRAGCRAPQEGAPADGSRLPAWTAAAAPCVAAGKAGDGVHFVAFQLNAPGKGVVNIEIVERHGTAFLRVMTESDAARAWIIERSRDIRCALQRSGLSLGGLDVTCRGREDRTGDTGGKAPAFSADSGRPGSGRHGPCRREGELIG